MQLFNLEVLTLGLLLMAAVLRARPQEVPVLTHTYAAQPTESWHPSVPATERFEYVTVIPGFVKSTPDTDHYARLEAMGLHEIRVSRAGQTIERRTFSAD